MLLAFFLLLLGSLLMPTSLLLLAFLLGCHNFVSDWMAHGHFPDHQFSKDIQVLKLRHFWKVAMTTALWQR
jgi:hypothetical protein